VKIQYFSDAGDDLRLPGFVTITNQSFRLVAFTMQAPQLFTSRYFNHLKPFVTTSGVFVALSGAA